MVNFPEIIHLYDGQQLTGDSANNDRFSIRNTHQYSMLMLVVRSQNGATSNSVDAAEQENVVNCITKITVKCDGKTVKEYSGEMCRSIAAHEYGCTPYQLRTQAGGGTWAGNDDPLLGWNVAAFPIIFSPKEDFYGDKGMMLPAPLYEAIDLFIEYDFSTVSATIGWTTGASAHVFDLYGIGIPAEDPEIMKKKFIIKDLHAYDWPTAASGLKDFELTLNNVEWYRRCFVSCYEAGIGEGIDVTDLKLLVNGKIFSEASWGQWQQRAARDRGLRWRETMYLKPVGDTEEIWTRCPATQNITYNPLVTSGVDVWTTRTCDKLTINGITNATDVGFLSWESPVLPHTAVIDFDADGKGMHMLSSDSAKSALSNVNLTKLQLRLTQAATGGDVDIVEQRIVQAVDL